MGSYPPNKWGLYDFHGNACEWCLDWSVDLAASAVEPVGPPSGFCRVCRGGSWETFAKYCPSASRDGATSPMAGDDYGFRLCLPAGPETAP